MRTTVKNTNAEPFFKGQILFLALSLSLIVNGVNAEDGETADSTVSKNATEEPMLDVVTVTARRQSESLQDATVSATVFDSEDIDKSGIEGISDYFLQTPNVSVNETGTRGDNSISMRGISNIGNGPNSSFALYVDEVNVIPLVSNPQIQDIERIEVLRGPQGTFFGKNAAGGAINITTARPTDVPAGNVFVGIASHDTYEGGIMFNAPVSEKLFLRGSGYFYETNGWIKNVNPVGGRNDQRNVNGRLSARYLMTDNFTIDTSITFADEYSGLESGVPTGKLSVGSIGLWGLNAFPELPFYPENTDRVNNDNPKETDYSYSLFNHRMNYVRNNLTFTSVTGYAKGGRDQVGDVDATSLDAVNLTRLADLDLFSQELRVAYDGSGPVKGTIGLAYSEQTLETDLTVILGSMNPLGAPPNTVIRALQNKSKASNFSVFGEFDYALTDRVTLTYGARYSDDTVEESQIVTNGTPMGPVTQVFEPVSRDFNNYSSKLALSYKLSDQITTYAMASQGYRAGGVQLDPVLERAEFDPETLWSYEIGAKGTLFDGRAQFAIALFRINWEDMQVRTTVNGIDPATGAFVITTGVENAAEASSTGVEVELKAYVQDDLLVGVAAGFLDAQYDEYTNAVVDGAVQLIDLSGKDLLDAPKSTFSAFAEKTFSLGGHEAYVRAEYNHVAEKVTSHLVYVPSDLFPVPFDFSFPYRVPSFSVVNMKAGIDLGKYALSAYVRNLTGENYYTGTFDDLFASGVHVRTHPREFGARLSYSF